MPFHVELSNGLNHARAFNLSREQLLAQVIAPWLEDLLVELGEQEWQPAECQLKILEGRHLDGPDLAFGQGWANAERSAENVTARELAAAPAPQQPDAFLVQADDPEQTVAELLDGQNAAPVAWSEARKRIDGRDPEVAAVILVVQRKP
ncbi:MAG TPA: hypothetical protein VHR65_03065 [Solirubrobacterales bacterium]|jgi:hypothetical protein|nr:hypothetical protein [Solirubrobacterales bacterium]